ncbi:MAG: DUF4878 domain-containing protein [Paludibacteraceae bacterium]|nr:DUF4878 domain-containing protein [Paludibacteraceae bacterium]
MLKTLRFALLAVITAVAVACTNSSPEAVASAFMEDVKVGNFDNIETLLDMEDDFAAAKVDALKTKLAQASRLRKIQSYKVASVDMNSDGTAATVKFTVKELSLTGAEKETTESVKTKYKKGKWYVRM